MKDSTVICGFGRTGKALLDFCIKQRVAGELVVYNDLPVDEGSEDFLKYCEAGVVFVIGDEGFVKLEDSCRVILSPGINGKTPRFERLRKKGVQILSEIQFASEYIDGKILGVTGTNGKSTTVSLIYHILKYAGFDVLLAGNIGIPLISVVNQATEKTFIVVEVSSFQLEEVSSFSPYLAVLMNITPDHIDRHGSMDVYTEAKLKIFESQIKGSKSIINGNLRDLEIPGKGERLNFASSSESEIQVVGDTCIVKSAGERYEVSLEGNPLKGDHNRDNVMVAVASAVLVGVKPELVSGSLSSFRGLPHRMEHVGEIEGTYFVNDSKATNIDATLKSLTAFERIVLILGGRDKDGDFCELKEEIRKRCVGVLLIGEAADKIGEQLEDLSSIIYKVKDLDEGVKKGKNIEGGKGGTVLLAPGCASFDMFGNFEDRGDRFREAVERLRGSNG